MWLIAKVVKLELDSFRESLMYLEISTFIGCVLARLREHGVISMEEERKLRKVILDG
jgi:hypothetical protein